MTSSIASAVLLQAVVWPLLAALHVLVLALLVGRLVHRDLTGRALGLAFAAGLVTALVGVRGIPHWPPADTLDWLGPLVGLAALVGIALDAAPPRWQSLGLILLAPALSLLGSRLLLLPPGGEPSSLWRWVALALCGLWALATIPRAAPAPSRYGAWAGALAGSAGVLALSGSALLGQVSGTAAILAGGLALLSFRPRHGRTTPGAVGPLVLAYGGILAYAWAFTEAPRLALILSLIAPAASLCGLVVRGPLRAFLLATLVAAALAGGWAAFLAFRPSTTPPPY